MIIFGDGTMGSFMDKSADKAYQFFSGKREYKSHFHYWTGLSQPDGNRYIAHMVEFLKTAAFSYGSVTHEDTGRLIHLRDYWSDDRENSDIEDPIQKFREKALKWRSISKFDYDNPNIDPTDLATVAGSVITWTPLGLTPDKKEIERYIDYISTEKNESQRFCAYLNENGYNAYMARGYEIDIIHDKYDPSETFTLDASPMKPKEGEEVYFVTLDATNTTNFFLPENTKMVQVTNLEETMQVVDQYIASL